MKNRILFLNVKHTSLRPEYLLSTLRSKGWEISTLDAEFKPIYKYFALLTSFHPDIDKWKSRLDEKMNIYNKLPSTFINKSRYLANRIKRHKGEYDLIFHSYGMYSHYLKTPKAPYVVCTDWTRALTIREHIQRAPIKSEKKVKNWLRLEGELYRNAEAVFTRSNRTRDSIINDYSVREDKVATAGWAPMLENIPEKNPNKDYSSKTILFIGYLFEWKGGDILLAAFKKVRDLVKDAKMVVMTKGQYKERIESAGATFIDSKVTRRSEVLKQFENASLFALPSFCEPFGSVFLEAMAYQLPCIGTDKGGLPEIIENNKTGFIVPRNNPEVLAEKIAFLLNDPALMKRMGEAGYGRLKERFTWNAVAGKIDMCLRDVLSWREPEHAEKGCII